MTIKSRSARLFSALAALAASGGPALAAEPKPWGLGLQPAASPVAVQMHDFHNLLLIIIVAVAGVVLALLGYVIARFNAKANPTPSKTSHNTLLEVIWTAIPILILLVIVVPSFKLLAKQRVIQDADMTVKVIGKQWYWTYEYPDTKTDSGEPLSFDSYMLQEEKGELRPDLKDVRLLSVDIPLAVPVGKKIRVQVTAADVLHAFAVPAFSVKKDAVPGRINETWFEISRYGHEPKTDAEKAAKEAEDLKLVGTYYGQCSELCGTGHAFMPIEIRAVSPADYERWLSIAAKEGPARANAAVLKLDRSAAAAK